ncbi:SH3 domain-containing protein [Nonomuraea sp. M3C6]|uniref:SH3 domain-containing protein n=1 Tax=Nonomuraea marmarensis TaxID=3351344 RepID=A0ABW7ATB8_9ACTN
MAIPQRITLILISCAATGGLMGAALQAQAATPPQTAPLPRLACTYQVTHVRPISFLNVRNGPALHYHPIGKRQSGTARFAGSCTATNGWIAVQSTTGKLGWTSAHYLRKIPAGSSHPTRPSGLACTYQVTHVRPISFLNVRNGPALHYHPIGKRQSGTARFAGSCTATNGWIAVQSTTGKLGWASAHYLRKV